MAWSEVKLTGTKLDSLVEATLYLQAIDYLILSVEYETETGCFVFHTYTQGNVRISWLDPTTIVQS